MERKLYTIITGDVHQSVLAGSFTQAITWAESNLPAIGGSELLTIRVDAGLVDLTRGPAKPSTVPTEAPKEAGPDHTPPRATRAPRREKTARSKSAVEVSEDGMPKGTILLADLALDYDLTREGVKYKLKRAGVAMQRIDGQGRPLVADERTARRALAGRADVVQQQEPSARLKAKSPAPATAPRGPGARMLLIEKAATELGLTDAQVSEIKRNGNVPGGNGWVDIDALRAYMESDEYEPPFASN